MSITISTAKPTTSASSAVRPARNKRRNVKRAATRRCAPRPMSCMMPFIFCARGNADREHQESTRIEYDREAQGGDDSELPHDGNERTGDDQRRAAHAARIAEDDQRGDQGGDQEVHRDLDQAIVEVAHSLAKPITCAHIAAGLLRISCEWLRCCATGPDSRGAVRSLIVVEQHDEHARAEVVADKAADDARARDVAAQLFDRLGEPS